MHKHLSDYYKTKLFALVFLYICDTKFAEGRSLLCLFLLFSTMKKLVSLHLTTLEHNDYWNVSSCCHNTFKLNNHIPNKILLLTSKYICTFSYTQVINHECLSNPMLSLAKSPSYLIKRN